MATVKFISEQDCQLFIDTVFAVSLRANQLKRINLQTGSYFIEVKSADNNTLSQYVLDIDEYQTQIVHQIPAQDYNIKLALDKIKEDPSVQFFNNRMKFQLNGKYGFINSRYEIIIKPEFSDAENFKEGKTLVKKFFTDKEKATIIDVDGNICYERWFDFIGEDETTLLLSNNEFLFTLNKNDYKILGQYKKSPHYNVGDLIFPASKIIGKDDFFGYLNKAGKEVIPFLYDYASNFNNNNFAIVERFGNRRAVDKDGNLYFSMEEALKDGKEETRRVYGDVVKEEKYIYKARKLTIEEAKDSDFAGNYDLDIYWDRTPVKVNDSWWLQEFDFDNAWDEETGILKDEVETTLDYKSDRILFFSRGFFAYRRNDKCYLLKISEPNKVTSYDYDEILPIVLWAHSYDGQFDTLELTSIRVRKNGKYGLIHTNGEILLPIIYDKIEVTEALDGFVSGKFGIIYKDNKCCLINLVNGYIPEDLCYDEIIENIVDKSIDSIKSTFIVRKNMKYGCRDIDWKEIVPTAYDSLDFSYGYYYDGYSYKILKYCGKKIGTYEYRKYYPNNNRENIADYSFSSKAEYDECIFLKNNNSITSYGFLCYIGVRIGEKWGIVDATPARTTYFPQDDSDWNNNPNLEDFELKYDSLESLIADADNEFQIRYNKYSRNHFGK